VKPTEREKTQIDNKPTYDGWLLIKENGSVYSAHCSCIGGKVHIYMNKNVALHTAL